MRYLPHQKTPNFGSLSRFRFCTDRTQNLPGPAANNECPKFHPSRFTSGGVIAERVNTVQTRHINKVLPILGEATVSSPSNYNVGRCPT